MIKFLKIAIGMALLAAVLSNSKLDQLAELIVNADFLFISLNIPLYIISIFISSYKWWLLVPRLSYIELAKSNFIAAYYMVFVPGQLVAEAIKGARLISDHAKANQVFCSIFVDKLLAFISLIALGLLGICLEARIANVEHFRELLILILLALCLILFCTPYLLSIFDRLTKFKTLADNKFWQLVVKFIDEYRDIYAELISRKRIVLASLAAGLVFQLINIYMISRLGASIDINFSFWTWAWISAILTTILMLPISIGGIGVREGGLALIFSLLGESVEKSLSFALMLYALTLMSALIGYGVDLLAGVRKATRD